MSGRGQTTMRAPRSVARTVLALLGGSGIVALLSLRPSLPTMPWQPLQPTTEELIRQVTVDALWLVLLAICVRLVWLALRRPGRAAPIAAGVPAWSTVQRGARRRSSRPADGGELLALFSRPQPAVRAEVWLPAAVPVAAQAVDSLSEPSEPTVEPSVEPTGGVVRVCLLGRLSVGPGGAGGLRERATRGLIAYLVLKRGPASMDELVEALWPGEAPGKARPRLWKAKRQAQRLLGDLLVRRQDSYLIERERLRTDIDELDGLRLAEPHKLEALERASALLAVEPLIDVDYAWADGERRRLRAVQAGLLEQLAEARLEGGDAGGALAIAERLIEHDRLNERGWCLAMEAEGVLGNRQAVLERYECLTRELDERLGLRPSGETRETQRRLLGQA